MMKTIEKTYEKLNMTLDNLPHNIVRVCEREGFTQEMRAIREAEDAARKVRKLIITKPIKIYTLFYLFSFAYLFLV